MSIYFSKGWLPPVRFATSKIRLASAAKPIIGACKFSAVFQSDDVIISARSSPARNGNESAMVKKPTPSAGKALVIRPVKPFACDLNVATSAITAGKNANTSCK